jgi:putative heme-binding domain-containing protein
LVAIRLGGITPAEANPILAQIGVQFPTGNNEVDRELAQVLVYLKAPGALSKVVQELRSSPSQENQIHYAMTLRNADVDWNPELRRQYFEWFNDMRSARGGMSFGGFIENIKKAGLKQLPDDAKQRLADVITPPKNSVAADSAPQRPLVKKWKVDDLLDSVANEERVPDFEQGKAIFASAQCYKCHRMGVQGGILGPDLTAAGGRFNVKDLLASIIEPDKEISDQYGATQFLTVDGRVVIGRVINMNGNQLQVLTNMLDPSALARVNRDDIETTRPSKTSMMPSGLLDTFNDDEIADLIAYLRAGGRASHPIYKRSVAKN